MCLPSEFGGGRKVVKFCVISLFATLAYSLPIAMFASDLGGYSDGEIIEILLGALVIGSVTSNVGMFRVSTKVLSQIAKSDLPVVEVNVAKLKRRVWIVLILFTLLAVYLELYRGNWVALGLTLILLLQTGGFLWKFLPLLRVKATLSPAMTVEMPLINKSATGLTELCLFVVYVLVIYVAR